MGITNFYQFCYSSPWMAFFTLMFGCKLLYYVLYFFSICVRGWPSDHVDGEDD